MKFLLYLLCLIVGSATTASPFMNHSFSPLIVGVSQFHQYDNPRFDMNASAEMSESSVQQVGGDPDLGLIRNSQIFKGMLFQRMPKSAGGLGLRFSAENHSFSGTRTSNSAETFFFKENKTDWVGTSKVAKINPFIAYSLTDSFTLGFEFRAHFYNFESETDSFDIENQYGVVSAAFHWRYFEFGGELIPPHREAQEDPLDGESLIEDQSIGDTLTVFARARFLDHWSVGGSQERYRIPNANGSNSSFDKIKAQLEMHIDERLNVEGYVSEKEYLDDQAVTHQGTEQEMYGGLIFRSDGFSSFAISYTRTILNFVEEKEENTLNLKKETGKIGLSGHWKL